VRSVTLQADLSETPTARIVLIDRRDRLVRSGPNPRTTFCAQCWEPLVFQPEPHPRIIPGYGSSNWKHARSGSVDCSPSCDAPGCELRGTVAIGQREWNGHGFEFVNQNFLCDAHHAEWRRTHPTWEHI
jgi:hypothetical protein